ncbi:MAG: AAA family ATPase [Syntrophorhabdaceae bacterium]|nr:AAA family ATPase [Syntrophorhabdaceae bacterium]
MQKVIAVAGKGGVGKTTMAGLMVRYLVEELGSRSVLAVDADPNSNLNEVLGMEVRVTIGDAREVMKKEVPIGMTKDVWFEYKVHEAVIEGNGFDLLVMGRPEGPGCYCAANTLAKKYIDTLRENYAYVVVDNEAGMEHISRLVTQDIDTLYIFSDATKRGIITAKRIEELILNLNLNIREHYVVVNRIKAKEEGELEAYARQIGIKIEGFIRNDDVLAENDISGRTVFELSKDSQALSDAYRIFEATIKKQKEEN